MSPGDAAAPAGGPGRDTKQTLGRVNSKGKHTPSRYEWRVTYRRADWLPTTSAQGRLFSTRKGARRFAAMLDRNGRPDLSPCSLIQVERRPVGPWEVRP